MVRYRKKDELKNEIFSLQAEFTYTRAAPNTISESVSYLQTLSSVKISQNKKLNEV